MRYFSASFFARQAAAYSRSGRGFGAARSLGAQIFSKHFFICLNSYELTGSFCLRLQELRFCLEAAF
jgi:hypothetical protein